MKSEELAKERGRRPADGNVQRVGSDEAISELDQRIENQRREDTAAKIRARLQATGSSATSPVKPGAYSVTTPESTPPSSGSPTGSSPSGINALALMEQDIATKARGRARNGVSSPNGRTELTQMEQDIATKAGIRVRNAPSVVMAPGVDQVATSQVPSGPSRLSQMEKDIATKASVRSTRSASNITMAPGAYSTSEPGSAPASASASGAPEISDAAIKARGRSRGAISTPSKLSQVEADVAAKARRSPAARAPGAVTEAAPGALASMTALEADVEAKSRGRSHAAVPPRVEPDTSAATQARAIEVVVSEVSRVGSEPGAALTSSNTSAPGAVAMTPVEITTLDERITYKTGIALEFIEDNELKQEPLPNKPQDSFLLSKDKDGKQGTLQDDLNVLENSFKDINAPHGYGGRGSGANGAGYPFDDNEHLAVAVAIEEEDDDKFLVSAVEYDPDSKPPLYKNRRFRMYGALMAIVLLGLLGVVLGLVLGGDDSKTNVDDGATSAPTTYRESLGIQDQIETVVGSDKLYNPSDAQYRALQWILHEDPNTLGPEDPSLIQRFLLAQFYLETSQKGPWGSCGRAEEGDEPTFCFYKQYNVATGATRSMPANRWLSEIDECLWSGIECNALNQVTRVDLANQKLTGTLPTELALLPVLEWIDVPLNQLTGTLPSEWGEMNHLTNIEVHNNTLTGTIPDTWWDLSATMTGLNLGNNRLTGSLPGDRFGGMSNMRSLFIDDNRFSGAIPTEVGLLTNLRNTRWNDNFFSGTFPTEFCQLTKLKEFWLHRLSLTGTIPTEIADMVSLTDFRVHFNGLNGTIPDGLYQHPELYRVDLFSTKIGGTISTEIGNMPRLRTFRISDCEFHGTIPTEMGLLPNIREVWLEGNDFKGEIPIEFCELRGSNNLEILVADCANTESTGFPAVTCKPGCCTVCCDTESSICDQ